MAGKMCTILIMLTLLMMGCLLEAYTGTGSNENPNEDLRWKWRPKHKPDPDECVQTCVIDDCEVPPGDRVFLTDLLDVYNEMDSNESPDEELRKKSTGKHWRPKIIHRHPKRSPEEGPCIQKCEEKCKHTRTGGGTLSQNLL